MLPKGSIAVAMLNINHILPPVKKLCEGGAPENRYNPMVLPADEGRAAHSGKPLLAAFSREA
jgi:hypothetical protein